MSTFKNRIKYKIFNLPTIDQTAIIPLFDKIDQNLLKSIWYSLLHEPNKKILISEITDFLNQNNNSTILNLYKKGKKCNIGYRNKILQTDANNMISLVQALSKDELYLTLELLENTNFLRKFYMRVLTDRFIPSIKDSALFANIDPYYQEVKKIKTDIIQAYLRVSYKIADDLSNNNEEFEDNFQNGIIGLDEAFMRYSQVNKKVTFGNYAYYWVRNKIMLKIKENSGFIKLPDALWGYYYRIQELKKENPKITIDEILEKLNLTKSRYDYVMNKIASSRTKSMDFKLNSEDEDDLELRDIITIEEDEIDNIDIEWLDQIDPWYRKLIILKNGLFNLLKVKGV